MGCLGCNISLGLVTMRANPSPEHTPTIITAYFHDIGTVKLQRCGLKLASSLSCSEDSSYKTVSAGTDMWTIQGGHVSHWRWAEARSRVPSPGPPLQWGWLLHHVWIKELRGRQFLTLMSPWTLFSWYGIKTHVFWQPYKIMLFLILGKSYWSLCSVGSVRQGSLLIDCHQRQGTNWTVILQNM